MARSAAAAAGSPSRPTLRFAETALLGVLSIGVARQAPRRRRAAAVQLRDSVERVAVRSGGDIDGGGGSGAASEALARRAASREPPPPSRSHTCACASQALQPPRVDEREEGSDGRIVVVL